MQYFILILAIFVIKDSTGISLEEELTLTYKQKLALDKFKDSVSSRLPKKYMNEDIYLIRWLRAKNFNVPAAEEMLMENLRWREENKLDTIHQEDWRKYEQDYRYVIEGCDKQGRPVVSVSVGDWDVRRAVIAGETRKMSRYFDKLMDEITTVIRQAQAQGKNVTQYSHIFDMGNYNLVQQGCPGCIPIFINLFTSYESHFPGAVHKMYLINTPDIFQALLSLLKPLMAPPTRNGLFIYGRDKREWQAALFEDISPDQLTKTYGGTRDFGFEIEEFRELGRLPC